MKLIFVTKLNLSTFISLSTTNFTTYGCKIVDTYGCTSCGTSRHHQGGLQLDVKGYDGSNEVYDYYGMGVGKCSML